MHMTAPAPISPIEMRLKRAENCKNLRHFLAPLRRIAWFPIFQAGCPECAHTLSMHSQVVDFAMRICKIKSTQKNLHQLPWIFCGVKICSKMWCGLFGVDFILVSAPLGWSGLSVLLIPSSDTSPATANIPLRSLGKQSAKSSTGVS